MPSPGVPGPPIPDDAPAQAAVLEKYRRYLVFLARVNLDPRLIGKVDSSGVVQQTLLEAHQDEAQWKSLPSGEQMAFLRRILTHNLQDEIRRLTTGKRDVRRERSLEQAIENSSRRLMAWTPGEDTPPPARLDKAERALTLAAALDRLPEAQRAALVLQHWQGWSLAEIADHMGRTPAAVAGLLKRGLRQLRDELHGLNA
jgi:RNA polymerase sigma-70 factor (ECF subfamily)